MIYGIKRIAKYLLGTDIAGRDLAVFPDDTFIVSYPRSGNTWTRFLIGNLIHSEPVTFANIERVVPDATSLSSRTMKKAPRPRLVKSHEYFDPRYPKVVYLVRDPRDVVLSLYRFRLKYRVLEDGFPIEQYLPLFLEGDLDVSWAEHVGSWLGARQNHCGFLLLRYEDMRKDPRAALEKIANFLAIESTPERITRAIELSSADRLRELEKAESEQWVTTKGRRQDIPFVGGAKVSGWKENLPPACVAQIEAAWGLLMTSLGYVLTTVVAPGSPAASAEGRGAAGAPAPAVSVIIPCYNSAPWISKTLDSVFAQTWSDFEVILINDGSSDTEALEQAIAPYHDRLVYLKQDNRGPSAARNAGIRRARGEYLAFLDSDDSWFPIYLVEQMQALQKPASRDLVYSDVLIYSSPGDAGVPYSRTYPCRGPVTFASLVTEDCAISTSFAVARRKAVVAAGLFDERFWRSEDFHLWLRMAHRGSHMTCQKKILGRHRERKDSLTSDNLKLLEAMVQVLQDLDGSLELTAGARAAVRRKIQEGQALCDLELGKRCLQADNPGEAAIFFQRANGFFRKTRYRLASLGLRIAPGLTGHGIRTLQDWRSTRHPA